MIDPTDSHVVLARLGEQRVTAIALAVGQTREDLALYRKTLPQFVSRHSQRGLLNWIHDQLFANIKDQFDADPSVAISQTEPTDEIMIDNTLRIRFKKHDAQDMVSNYPTAAWRAWSRQDLIPAFSEIRLIAGFRWDAAAREMRTPVISARDGEKNVLWAAELHRIEATTPIYVPSPVLQPEAPALPVFEIADIENNGDHSDEQSR
jgi:hypothetical protein